MSVNAYVHDYKENMWFYLLVIIEPTDFQDNKCLSCQQAQHDYKNPCPKDQEFPNLCRCFPDWYHYALILSSRWQGA